MSIGCARLVIAYFVPLVEAPKTTDVDGNIHFFPEHSTTINQRRPTPPLQCLLRKQKLDDFWLQLAQVQWLSISRSALDEDTTVVFESAKRLTASSHRNAKFSGDHLVSHRDSARVIPRTMSKEEDSSNVTLSQLSAEAHLDWLFDFSSMLDGCRLELLDKIAQTVLLITLRLCCTLAPCSNHFIFQFKI